jgi:nucleoid-associated protein EbfC
VNLEEIMKAAQSLQSSLAQSQAKLEHIEVDGSAGAGLVIARCTAKGKLVKLTLDPGLLKAEEREMLEDLVVAAVNDAQRKAAQAAEAEMAKLTQGLPIPPGFKMPF